MSPKQIIIVVILATLFGTTVTSLFIKLKEKPKDSIITVDISPTPTKLMLSTWEDPAGFSFQYPSATTIDKHPEDSANYANLTLTLPSTDTIDIIVADNKFKNLDAWVGQNSAIDTTLGGIPAKKIIKEGITILACIDLEVLVTIKGKDISQIVDSWTFVYPTSIPSKVVVPPYSGPSDDGDVLEEE